MTGAAVTRFVLTSRPSADTRRGGLDGAWWPASTDLTVEVPQLVADAAVAGLSISRVTYHLEDWPKTTKRRLVVAGQAVHLGGYHRQAAGTISVSGGSNRQHLDLLLIAPDTDEASARHQLDEALHDAASEGTNGQSSSAEEHPDAWAASAAHDSAASVRAR